MSDVVRLRVAMTAGGVMLVLAWWLGLQPSKDRDWQPEAAVFPYADIAGTKITLHNIRNSDYRNEIDYTDRHYGKMFDLAKLRPVDLFIVYWDERKPLDQSLPFAQLKARCLIIDRAMAADQEPAFSKRIRGQLPGIARALNRMHLTRNITRKSPAEI